MADDRAVRLTANVTPEVALMLQTLADAMGTTKTQALNQAVATTKALYDAEAKGQSIQLKKGTSVQKVSLPKKK